MGRFGLKNQADTIPLDTSTPQENSMSYLLVTAKAAATEWHGGTIGGVSLLTIASVGGKFGDHFNRSSLGAAYTSGGTGVETINISTVTTSGTGSTSFDNGNYTFVTEGQMIGALVFQTTIAAGAVVLTASTIRELGIYVDDTLKSHLDFNVETQGMPNMTRGQTFNNQAKSPNDLTILDNFRWLPFSREPIPAGSRVRFGINAGITAEAVRIMTVQTIPV